MLVQDSNYFSEPPLVFFDAVINDIKHNSRRKYKVYLARAHTNKLFLIKKVFPDHKFCYVENMRTKRSFLVRFSEIRLHNNILKFYG